MYQSESETPLKKFNTTLPKFLDDLKNVFGENDIDIIRIETAVDLTSMNARIIMKPFQSYVLKRDFVKGIMNEDVGFFLNQTYENIVQENEYGMYLVNKFKATVQHLQHDPVTVKKVFDWFKLLIYYAYEDQGKDPMMEMQATL